ncbi:MAG: hypothetical protein ABSH38_14615 [Verrucomicrobiota bacterium]|jgi:hypothetical protein
MRTADEHKLSGERSDSESSGAGLDRAFSRVILSYSQSAPRSDSFKFRPAGSSLSSKVTDKKQRVNPKRRLRGFLVEMQTDNARVAFVDNGQTILYDLPAEHLRKAGITAQNQPFQMDEIENMDEDGAWCVGYRFLALAKASDAEIEVLKFDGERKRKRDIIFQEFSKAKA